MHIECGYQIKWLQCYYYEHHMIWWEHQSWMNCHDRNSNLNWNQSIQFTFYTVCLFVHLFVRMVRLCIEYISVLLNSQYQNIYMQVNGAWRNTHILLTFSSAATATTTPTAAVAVALAKSYWCILYVLCVFGSLSNG